MSEWYAVLEWQEGNDGICSVISKNDSKETAELMVKIAPPHLPREIVTMEELEKMERV